MYIENYKLIEDMEAELFRNAIVVFDTSSLLRFYNYSDNSKENIYDNIYKKFSGRLWISGHVNFEFNKNRENVLRKPIHLYENLIKEKKKEDSGHLDKIEKIIDDISKKSINDIEKQMTTLIEKCKNNDKHPIISDTGFIEIQKIIEDYKIKTEDLKLKFIDAKKIVSDEVELKIEEIKNNMDKDFVSNKLIKIFEIGQKLSYEEELKIVEEGELRYRNKIPPGYEDANEKKGLQIYGDLINWKEIIKFAKTKNKPFILVSNDEKEDWIDDSEGENRPRYELIKEFRDITGEDIWIYNLETFLYKSKEILHMDIDEFVINEINEVEIEEENNIKNSMDKEYLKMWVKEFLNIECEIEEFNSKRNNTIVFETDKENCKKHIIYISFTKKNSYTAFLDPLKNAIEDKVNFDKYGSTEMTFIIVAKHRGAASKFYRQHATREKPKSIIKSNFKHVNVLIAYRDEDGGLIPFDYVRENS